MEKIETFIESPGANDIPVKDVFTEDMFTALEGRMNAAGWGNVRSYWETDYQNRKIISQFMKVRYDRQVQQQGNKWGEMILFSINA